MLGAAGLDCTDLSAHPSIAPPEETGRTFLANACLKARTYALHLQTWTLADDSGLEVDALDAQPGVHSSRWAAMQRRGEGDVANNSLLLERLAPTAAPARTARFVCVLALADPQARIVLTSRGTLAGRIIDSARGSNGFGYDPLFYVDGLDRTTAELSPEDKHKISHRGNALRRLRVLMSQTALAG